MWLISRGWNWTTLVLLALFVAGTAGSFWNLYQREVQLSHAYPLQGTALQMLTLEGFSKLYTEDVVSRVKPYGIEATHDYAGRANAIPLPTTLTMELGKRISKDRPGAHIRLYSEFPFPWRADGGPRDDFEREALAALRERPDLPFYRFEEFEGRASLRYAVAEQLTASCVSCHNNHRDSPKKDWKVGDVRGVLEFIRPLDNEVAEGQVARQRDLFITLTMAGLGMVGLGLVYYCLRRTAASLGVSESRMRAVLTVALDCIVLMDHHGNLLEFNPAAEKLFGHQREDVLGMPLAEILIPLSHRQAHKDGLRHYLATGEGPMLGKRLETTALRSDGTEFPVELTVDVIQQHGAPVFTAYLRDLTERKRHDAILAERVALSALKADVAHAVTTSDNPRAILQHCSEAVVHHLDAAFARIWTLNESEQVLELQTSAGMYTHTDGPHRRVPVGQFKIGKIAQERAPHLTNHVVGDPASGTKTGHDEKGWSRSPATL